MIFEIKAVKDEKEKERAIVACDEAFSKPVTMLNTYKKTLDKVCRYADFLIAYHDEELMGYVAAYNNDKVQKISYIPGWSKSSLPKTWSGSGIT